MPHLNIKGTDLFYRDEGKGDEILVFAHGLLFSSEMFRNQVKFFRDRYRCISIDFKGQGNSAVGEDGYDMDTLTDEVREIINVLELKKYHFIGLSMGGFVGMRMALRVPDQLHSLILLNTTASPEPGKNIPKYTMLNFIARWFGLGLVIDKVMKILFAAPFLNDPDRSEQKEYWRKKLVANHKIGITRAVRGVIGRIGVDSEIHGITVPTLILSGEFDTATMPEYSMQLNEKIRDSEWKIIPGAGHSTSIENPEMVNQYIDDFLQRQYN